MARDHATSDDQRGTVLQAVRTELGRWGIDRFDLAATVARHRLDDRYISGTWPDTSALVVDALTHRSDDDGPPDTGSLVEDLFQLARGMARLISSTDGPKLHGAHLITDPYLQTVDIRRAVWKSRAEALRVVFDRAHARGEVRSGISPETSLEMLFAPINMRVLYTGEPVSDDYCRTVADLVWRSIAAAGAPPA